MLFSEELIYAFGWTILHSLWQASLIAIILMLFLRRLRSASAVSRYWAAVSALGAVLMLAVFTFSQLYEVDEAQIVVDTIAPIIDYPSNSYAVSVDNTTVTSFSLGSFFAHCSSLLEAQLPIISLLWLIGVSFFSMRFGFGLLEIAQLKKSQQAIFDTTWEARLESLANRLGIVEKVRLGESLLTKVPITMGHFKPIILLPIGTINALPVAQVEAILAHELAHIARKDYLVNLLQSMLEICFFFNPAVWWISTKIRIEREHCCDDQVLAVCADRLTYAKALLQLKTIQYQTPTLSLSLFRSKNQLLKRVQRILNHPNQQSSVMEKFAVTCLLLITLICFSWQQNKAAELEMPAPEPAVASAEFEAMTTGTVLDTLPNAPEGRTTISYDNSKKKIETEVVDGVIQSLKINGKTIPKSEFKEYEGMVQELINDLPEPPTPPNPPSPPADFVSPPTPPAPPSPPAPIGRYEITEQGEDSILQQQYGRIEAAHEAIEKQHRLIEKEHQAVEQMHRKVAEAHEEIALAHQQIELAHQAIEQRKSDFLNELGAQLMEDGIIKNTKRYQFELDNKQLKVDGKIQSAAAFEKYKALIEAHKGKKFSRKDRVKIKVAPNSQSVHFDFSMGGGKYRNEGPMPQQMLENLYATEALFEASEPVQSTALHTRKLMQKIGASLKQDQVLKNDNRYSFILNARTKKLVVNGQHYPNLQAKYEDIIRHAINASISSDFVYEFEYRGLLPSQVELSNYVPNKHRTYGSNADAYQTYLFDNFALTRLLNQQLNRDRLIDQPAFKLKIDDHELHINGKKQPKALQEQYETLFRNASNQELTANFQLAVEQYDNGNTDFIIRSI